MATDFMVTIFEGPDCCGKSTLIDKLMKAGAAQRQLHFDNAPGVGMELISQYLKPLQTQRPDVKHLVYDRSWLSEPIYGRVMRAGADRIGIAGQRYLERLAFARRAVVVMPGATLAQCAQRYAARKSLEYLDSEAKLRAMYDLYAQLGQRTALPAFIAEPDVTPTRLMERLAAERPAANAGPGIGHWAPGRVTLLVGEQTNDLSRAEGELPFVDRHNRTTGCSFWLAYQLEQWGVSERDLYWINALDRKNVSAPPDFLAALQPRRVIALGKVAERWCQRVARVKHEAVEHPQYWKRFRHHEAYPLKELLK